MVEVELPEGLRVIRRHAFYGCFSLWRINFPSTLEEIGEAAFAFLIRDHNVHVPHKVFSSKLAEVILPEGKFDIIIIT